jgi:hypothetical protein
MDDFLTSLSLGLNLNYQAKTAVLSLLGHISQNIYAKEPRFNNTSEDLSLNFKKDFSKYDTLGITNTFTHAEEPRSFEDAFGSATGRYAYFRNKFSLVYIRAVSKMLSILARFTNEADYFSRKDILDSTMNTMGAELNYIISSATILLFSNDFSRRDFLPGPEANTDTLLAGIKQYLTSQLSFEAKAGIDFLKSYNDSKYTKPIVTLSLIDEMDKNTRSIISFTKRYYTNAYEEDLFDYQEFSCNIIRQLSERLGVTFRGFYGRGKYIAQDIKDTLGGIGLGFIYDLRRNIKLKAAYAYSQVDSNSGTRDYKKNVFSLGYMMEF